MIYFFVFAISSIVFGIGIKYKRIRLLCVSVAVLVLSLFAGFRDFSIGTDIQIYGLYVFEGAQDYSSIIDLIFNNNMTIEIGYAIIAYISAQIYNNPHFFFFMVGLINYSLIAFAICKYEYDINPTMAWIFFLFLFFSDTFNIMRQTLSLAMFLVGFNYVNQKKYIQLIVCSGIAFLFHRTAVIGIMIYVVYYYMCKSKGSSLKPILIFSCIAFVITVIIPYLYPILIKAGILPEIYKRYLGDSTLGLSIKSVLIRIIPLAIILFYEKKLKKQNDFRFLLFMLIIDILLCNLATLNVTFERIGLWFGYFRIFAYSKLLTKSVVKGRDNRFVMLIILLVYCIVIFYYQIIIKGGNQIFPYTSNILGL